MKLVQHLDAGHDPNGNPRRLFMVIDPSATEYRYQAVVEGYGGIAVIWPHINGADYYMLPAMKIPAKEYHRLVKEYPEV